MRHLSTAKVPDLLSKITEFSAFAVYVLVSSPITLCLPRSFKYKIDLRAIPLQSLLDVLKGRVQALVPES